MEAISQWRLVFPTVVCVKWTKTNPPSVPEGMGEEVLRGGEAATYGLCPLPQSLVKHPFCFADPALYETLEEDRDCIDGFLCSQGWPCSPRAHLGLGGGEACGTFVHGTLWHARTDEDYFKSVAATGVPQRP